MIPNNSINAGLLCDCSGNSDRDYGEAPAWKISRKDNAFPMSLSVEGAVFIAFDWHAGLWRCSYWDNNVEKYTDLEVCYAQLHFGNVNEPWH